MRSILPLLLLTGCAAGFQGDRPDGLFETVPQARPYRELARLDVAAVGYGISDARARESALERLHARAVLLGADAVVDATAARGCSLWPLLVVAPNCYATATGIAVAWED